jgi:hypothetical protein
MGQDWTANLYDQATEADTTLGNMELMFATLKSMFSGAAAPANTVAGMPWFDTAKKVSKRRDQGDAAWFGLMHGDVNQKIWVYRNAAMEGWAIDATPFDKVLALKGGATYTAGAAAAGSWTVSGLTNAAEAAHIHAGPSHTHAGGNTGLPSSTLQQGTSTGDTFLPHPDHTHVAATSGAGGTGNTGAGSSHNHVISSDATWRIAASVGTLQYLDL